MSLNIRIEISTTDHPDYETIQLRTSEFKIDLANLEEARLSGTDYRLVGNIEKYIGSTLDNSVFLDEIVIQPKVRLMKLPDIEEGSL